MTLVRRILAYAVLGLLGAVACQNDAPVGVVPDHLRMLDADQVLIDGDHRFTQEGIRTAYLLFDTAYQWRDSVNMHLVGLTLTLFHEDGRERARVTSDAGTLDRRGDRMTARRNVVLVVPGEGRRLESEELHYDPEADRIWSDSAFVMTHEGRTLRGSSFTSDTEFRNFRILGPER